MKLKSLFFSAALAAGVVNAVHADVKVFGYSNFVHTWETAKRPAFDQVNTNLMMQHEVDRYRFFTEIEFQHIPAHDSNTTNGTITTSGNGAINVERAYAEAFVNKYLTFRLGKSLNTTLWVDNHYPSIVTPVNAPQLAKSIFQEAIEGIQVRGDIYGGLSYIAYYSEKTIDKDTGLASMGAHLALEQNLGPVWMKAALLGAKYQTVNAKDWNQKTSGAELQLKVAGLTIWSEYATRSDDKILGNNIRGYYALASYSIDTSLGEFIPFGMIDSMRTNGFVKNKVINSIGLTYRPIPTISIKSEFAHTPEQKVGNTIETIKNDKVSMAFVYFYN